MFAGLLAMLAVGSGIATVAGTSAGCIAGSTPCGCDKEYMCHWVGESCTIDPNTGLEICEQRSGTDEICETAGQTAQDKCEETCDAKTTMCSAAYAEKITCDGSGGAADGPNDGGHVSPGDVTIDGTGVRHLSRSFYDGLLAAPELLLDDNARLQPYGRAWRLVDVHQGSVAFELGLRSGDQPASINGMSLGTIAQAYAAKRALQSQRSFSLRVVRGSTTITLRYIVDP